MTARRGPPRAGEPHAAVHQAALRLLGYRARSFAELRQRLIQRAFAPEIVEAELDRLKHAGLLDDSAFAASWIEERMRLSPRGTAALRRELRQRGIAAETIDAAIAAVDDRETAIRLARSRAPALQSAGYETFMRRLAGYLERRGIASAAAAWAAQRAWEDIHADGDSTGGPAATFL